MEISNVKLVKPFGPLVMMAELPETVVKSLNEIVDVVKDKKDMGSRLAGQIKSESEIPHSMLEQKNIMNVLHTVGKSYVAQAYLNAGKKDLHDAVNITTQMRSIWSVSQYENEYNPQHNHSNCQISAVLYLKIPSMTPRNIVGKSNLDGKIEFTFCNTDSIFTTGSFVVNPKVGTLLLFPSHLHHRLTLNDRSDIRYSMAMNYMPKGQVTIGDSSFNYG